MKKFVALLLAMLLVLVNVAVLSEGLDDLNDKIENLRQQATEGEDPHFIKTYDTNVTGVVPTETLTFTVVAGTNPDTTMITVGTDNEVEVSAATTTVPVNVPTPSASAFTLPGEYTYTVTEVAGSSQGTSTYDTTTPITVKVYVIYDLTSTTTPKALKVLGTNVYTSIDETKKTKTDEITNVYEVGNLNVSKSIDGNLADASMDFTMEVKFQTESSKTVNSDITIEGDGTVKATEDATEGITSIGKSWTGEKTVYVTVKGGQSVDFKNIPAGVSYTVTETKAYNPATMTEKKAISNIASDNTTQINNANVPEAYTVTTTYSDNTNKKIAKGDNDTVAIENYKGVEIPTGIALDTVPYILILAVAMLGVVLTVRRREEY